MAFGSDFLFTVIVFFVICGVAVAVVFTYQNILPAMNAIPGFNQSYTPEVANGVICQTSNQIYLNKNNLTVNSVSTVNTICQTTYGPGSVSWSSPLQALENIGNNYSAVDSWLYWMFILISFGIIAAAALLPSNPIVLTGTFIMMIIVVFISFEFSNVAHTFFSAPILANAVLLFPQTLGIWAYLPYYECGFFLILLVILATKSRGGGSGMSGASL